MKTNNFYKICTLLTMMSLSVSCTQDDTVILPKAHENTGIEANITIAEVKELFDGNNITTFPSDLILEGYVVSSDASGNFREELYIQDHPSNPTAGIRLALERDNLYLNYDIGRKVFVYLNGLSLGKGENDILSIGWEVGGTITGVDEAKIPDVVIPSNSVNAIKGKPVLLSNITPAHIGMYVSVAHTQLNKDQLGLSFADAADNSGRTLESCAEDASFTLETSAYAAFGEETIPGDAGTISGIVTGDYNGNGLSIMLNSTTDMAYNEARCDIEVLDCGTNPVSGESIIFSEDFEGISGEDDLDNLGWINVNTTGSAKTFAIAASEENTFMTITAPGTDEDPLEVWLISPAVNLDATTSEELSFDIKAAFEGESSLSVFITNNYTGNPETTQWILVNTTIPQNLPDDPGYFSSSGLININCLSGDVRIAFRYQDSNPDPVAQYNIDNVTITGNY